jgi:arginyl-tRNA synthetase
MEIEEFERNCKEKAEKILNDIEKAEGEDPYPVNILKKLLLDGLQLFDSMGNFRNIEFDKKKLENILINNHNVDIVKETLKKLINSLEGE